ncbi:MAG: diaminopimelate epimerase [Terriglobia bacterium]
MKQPIEIPFEKLQACGNDFIVTRPKQRTPGWGIARAAPGPRLDSATALRRLAIAICDRHRGVGADGFLALLPPRDRKDAGRVRFFNADGSEAEMSGNGIRCVARFLASGGRLVRPMRFETPAGVREVTPIPAGDGEISFRVAMGSPVFEPDRIPFRDTRAVPPVTDYPLTVGGREYRVTVTSMGNPHCSLFVSSFDFDWREAGRALESSPAFPNRTNVEFVRVLSKAEIAVRFWERGVGETASSGTGSCGAAVAAILNGFTNRRVRVRTSAGVLKVEWSEAGEVFLTAQASRVASGVFRYSAS